MIKRFDEFYRDVALPAWNRAGVNPVGVFDLMIGPDAPTKYILLPFKSLEVMAAARERFESDAEMTKSDFANVPATGATHHMWSTCPWVTSTATGLSRCSRTTSATPGAASLPGSTTTHSLPGPVATT